MKWEYAPTGLSDLVVYFLRRIYDLLRPGGFVALITTNSIKDGDVRIDGLQQVSRQGGELTFAVSGTKWPGVANLYVSLFSLHNGSWDKKIRHLDGREVSFISTRFEDYEDQGAPIEISANEDRLFVGSYYLGDGFLLSHEEAKALKSNNSLLSDVIAPALNGQELSNHPTQTAARQIINFGNRTLETAESYGDAIEHVRRFVKPERDVHPEIGPRTKWWLFKRPTTEMYSRIRHLDHCFVIAQTGKHHAFCSIPANSVILQTC